MITLGEFKDLQKSGGPWWTVAIKRDGEIINNWRTCDRNSDEMFRVYANAILVHWEMSGGSIHVECRA